MTEIKGLSKQKIFFKNEHSAKKKIVSKERMLQMTERFKEFQLENNLPNKEIAKRIGFSEEYISQILNNKREITVDVLVGLKDSFGLSSDEILYGYSSKSIKAIKPKISRELQNEFVIIPQISGRISAGGGLVPVDNVEMRIAFRKDWIQSKGSPQNMSLIHVSGDSMEPTLESGDIVLIDHNRNYVDPNGGIYAVVIQEEIMVKRLQMVYPSNRIRIISDNAKYEPMEVEFELLKINGKVVWFGREVER